MEYPFFPSLITNGNGKAITGFSVVEEKSKLLKVLKAANHGQDVKHALPPSMCFQGWLVHVI